ncbi:hypothetical protein ACWC4E_33890 [Streptomyces sp. NPDC001273]|uniref:hypothetical protein n=1 Tax=unclassified Streptomyces TaxID=2593676 RepID=UPI003406E1CC
MPSLPQWIADDGRPIVRELWTVRTRSSKGLRNDPYDQVPTLERLAEDLFGASKNKFKRDKVSAVIKPSLVYVTEQQRQAAGKLFDLSPGMQVVSLKDRLDSAGNVFGVGREAFSENREKGGKYEQKLIGVIAESILKLSRINDHRCMLSKFIDGNFKGYGSEVPYIERPELSDQFSEALARGSSPIVVSGAKGVGKTRFALEMCTRHSRGDQKDVLCFKEDFHTREGLVRIGAELLERGVEVSHPFDVTREGSRGLVEGETGIQQALKDYLKGESYPSFAIVDEASEEPFTYFFLAAESRSTIVLTSSREGFNSVKVIRVPPMSAEESFTFAQELIAKLPVTRPTDEHVKEMVRAAGYRPGIIESACRMLAQKESLEVSSLTNSLIFTPSLFFEIAEPSWSKRVTTHYSNIIKQLETKDPICAVLLKVLALLDGEKIHSSELNRIASSAYSDILDIEDPAMQSLAIQQATTRLEGKNLIQVEHDFIYLNPLTRQIVRELVSTDEESVSRILQAIQPAQDKMARLAQNSRMLEIMRELEVANVNEYRMAESGLRAEAILLGVLDDMRESETTSAAKTLLAYIDSQLQRFSVDVNKFQAAAEELDVALSQPDI